MFKCILVGIDGSKAAEDALVVACKLAKTCSADLHLIHTQHPLTAVYGMGMAGGFPIAMPVATAEDMRAAAEKVIASAKTVMQAQDVTPASTEIADGDAAERIVTRGKDIGADLIVTGRRGLGNLGALVQGSTSQRINHLADCACLTVP